MVSFNILFDSPWYWLVAGILLIAAEAVVPGALLLWIGVAGMAVGLFVAAWPEAPLSVQLVVLALCMVVSVVVGLRFQSRARRTTAHTLNTGVAELKGAAAIAIMSFTGQGRVRTGDSFYPAFSLEPINKGDTVMIVDVRGGTLYVEPVLSPTN